MKKPKIEMIKTEDLRPYQNNPKAHPPEQIDLITESIKEFGFQVPVLTDKDNVIMAGHGRHLAAQQLGLKTIPVIRADDLTPDQIRAYRIMDNKLPELAPWDWTAIARDFTLEEITDLTPRVGMSDKELNQFIDATHNPLTPSEVRAAADNVDMSNP